MKTISIVTTMTKQRGQHNLRDSRCVGFFFKEEEAIEAVLKNTFDLYEMGYYPLAVVEVMPEGIYPHSQNTTWFQWNRETEAYEAIDECPEDLQKQFGWGMG